MTSRGNSRLAGISYLLYIVTGIGTMIMMSKTGSDAPTSAARVAAIVEHEMVQRVNVVLTLVQAAFAVILGVTLYALTRDEDRELALLGFCSRLAEGIVALISCVNGLALIHLVTNNKEDIAAAHGVESWLNATDGVTFLIAGLCFAIGSTLFCYLFLRARSIPLPLAWVGLISSILLVIALPLGILDIMKGGMAIWMPMLVFEVWFAFWLIFKGVPAPQPRTT